jgi:hypothetical protein
MRKKLIIVMACVLCMVGVTGSALAQNTSPAEKGIVDLSTNYGDSEGITSVVGVSGTTDTIKVTFAGKMNPGTFGMGLNFAKTWTKTWNADNTVLTIGGDLDLSAAVDPTLIVYLMQTDAARKDIAEPNIFMFQDINVTGTKIGNGQADVYFDIQSANGKGYSVYTSDSEEGTFELYDKANFNSKGAHITGLESGKSYWAYVEYKADGLVATRTAPVAITPPELPVTVSAQVRCLAGTAYVAVQARNDHNAAVNVALRTPYGERSFPSVAPGANAYQSFGTRAASIAAGSATVQVTGSVDGQEAATVRNVEYPAVNCVG